MHYFFFSNKVSDLSFYSLVPQVSSIVVDIERLGKHKRQEGTSSFISDHDISDVRLLKSLDSRLDVGLRIDPCSSETKWQLDAAISYGVDYIILPMFRSSSEVTAVLDALNARCPLVLLFETPDSLAVIDSILSLSNFKSIHFGLNDLHLGFGMKSMFEVLDHPLFLDSINFLKLNHPSLSYGIGGLGFPLKDHSFQVSPSDLSLRYASLGSQQTILSRSFLSNVKSAHISPQQVASVLNSFSSLPPGSF